METGSEANIEPLYLLFFQDERQQTCHPDTQFHQNMPHWRFLSIGKAFVFPREYEKRERIKRVKNRETERE